MVSERWYAMECSPRRMILGSQSATRRTLLRERRQEIGIVANERDVPPIVAMFFWYAMPEAQRFLQVPANASCSRLAGT